MPALSRAATKWREFKKSLAQDYGVRFGGYHAILNQFYSNSLTNDDVALGQKFAFNGSIELVGRDTHNVGAINIAVEDRCNLTGQVAPLFGGLRVGSIVPTTGTFGDFDIGITQLYWSQRLFENRVKFDIGKVFAANYINPYPFLDDNRQFLNLNFSTSPTIATPLRGLGGAVNVHFADNLYIRAGIYNANSDDTGSTVGNSFEKGEYFHHVELGWTGDPFKPVSLLGTTTSQASNVHVTLWHKDRQIARAVPESWGVAFNANVLINDKYMPFVRGGWSDGKAAAVDANIAAGVGLRPFDREADLFGFAFGWASPSAGGLRD